MSNRPKIFVLCSCLLALPCGRSAISQQSDEQLTDELIIPRASSRDTTIMLPSKQLIPASLKVFLDSLQLKDSIDYIYIAPENAVRIFLSGLSLDTGGAATPWRNIRLSFNRTDPALRRYYRRRSPQPLGDGMKAVSERIDPPARAFSPDDLFGPEIEASGSMVRGFSMGTNRDVTLNSGFRMQIAGRLSDDLDVVGSLTDENSPLQPEGTTQTLQEIDKVLIELRGKRSSASLGDIDINVAGNEFGNVNRKLAGAKGSLDYGSGDLTGELFVTGAVARGKFTTNEIQGIDGVQGPYRLTGERGNHDIIVIAGTERVFINGEKMLRGEQADYVIDYSNAELIFTSGRMIFRGSRIIVDFEYTDRQFNRTLYGGKAGLSLLRGKMDMNISYFQEDDDEDGPLGFALSDSDRTILREAGGDPQKAYRSGVENVGAGRGQYGAVDTVVKNSLNADTSILIYRFNPLDTIHSVYNLAFSFVGDGYGNYGKKSIGVYEFAGLGKGSYEPIKYLPLPEKRGILSLDFKFNPAKYFYMTSEYGLSSFSANKFSPLAQNGGHALSFTARYSPDLLEVGGLNLGRIELSVKNRFTGKYFSPMDRWNEVEFNRDWNVTDGRKNDENLFEGNILYRPSGNLVFEAHAGEVARGETFNSARYRFVGEFNDDQSGKFRYSWENIRTEDSFGDSKGGWIKQYLDGSYRYGSVEPRIFYALEKLMNNGVRVDTLLPGSYNWSNVGGGVKMKLSDRLSVDAMIGRQRDDSAYGAVLVPVSERIVQEYKAGWRPGERFSTSVHLTSQIRRFSQAYRDAGHDDNSNLLLAWETNANQFNRSVETEFYYEGSKSMSARLERIFQKVPKGTGAYSYLGDLNGNRVIDQEDFQPSRFDGDYQAVVVPGDRLQPVAEVKAAARFRFDGARIAPEDSWPLKIISSVSTETYLRVEEKNLTGNAEDIYLLRLSRFQDDSTTLAGSELVLQEVNLFKENRIFSATCRFTQNKSLMQYATFAERRYKRDQIGRIRLQLVEEITNQTELSLKTDLRNGINGGLRRWAIKGYSFSSDWSYRPWQDLELGFRFGFGNSVNFDTSSADINEQSVRCQYNVSLEGQMRVEFSREEVSLRRVSGIPLYELTDGRSVGQNWLWRFLFDYRLAKYLRMEINYFGRSERWPSLIHDVKAELRAFF